MEIKWKVALVTGGAKRLGKACCEMLARKGACLAIHYHQSEKEARELCRRLREEGHSAEMFRADLSDAAEAILLAETVEKKLGPIQILINNASIFEKTPFAELEETAWERHLAVNLKAPFFLSQKMAATLKSKNLPGKIINLADYEAVKPSLHYLAYGVSKAGLVGLTKALAKELAPDIQVNAIAPGPIVPPAFYTEELRKTIAQKTLLKRWGDPEEIARAALFLLEGTDYATGSVLFIEGGRLLA